ncbi:MAG: AsmA family protein [Gammaproteobacteria bacterium]|nr:AsmA family protein [Gammaproteobacteria bacterium]MBU1656049.1 AsmA family protein [Gammaproteobacteria bacterium]MBU1962708.1 AsmA family protein [Gammaproteobacteria bacterium]
MKTLLKILLYLLLLLVVAALALPLVVDPNDFKGQITEQVEKRTGRSFVIDGDIKLSVFPWLGVELNQARLGNAPGFGDEPMVQVEQAGVRVKLIPLLQKKLEVDTLVLYGLQANLVRSKEGRANWDGLAGKEQAGGTEGGEGGARKGAGPAALLIGGIDIRDAKVSWQDRAAGKSMQLDDLNITTSRLIMGQPFDISSDAKIRQLPKGAALSFALNGKVAFDAEGKKISMVPFELVLAELEAGKSLNLQGVVDLDLAQGTLELKDLTAATGDLRLKGGLRVTNFNQTPNLAGAFNLEPFSPRKLMQGWGMTAPQTADAAVLERCAMSFTLGGTPDRFSLDKIKFQLDDTHVDGNAKVVLAARPTVNFSLKGDSIDLDRYMAPPSGVSEGGANAAAPLAILFAADMNGNLGLEGLKINKLKVNKIALKIDQFNGRLQVDQSVGAFYQGSYRGMAVVDASKKLPSLRYTSSMTGLQVGDLLKDMQGDSRLEGRGDISAEINSQGADMMAIRKAMTGQIDIQFRDGAVKGFNLAEIIRDAKAKFTALQGGGAADESASSGTAPKTDFSELTAKALIKGVVIDNTSLAMKSPYLRVDGKGTLDTQKEWLDYNLRTVVVNSDVGQGGKELTELENIPLPMKFQGPLGEVGDWRKWRIDFQDVLKAKVEQRAKEEIGKFLQKSLGPDQQQTAPAQGGGTQPQSTEEKAMELLRQKLRF